MTNEQIPRRGRLRVERHDQARDDQVEHRRTRMRLAQRSYRARKETAFNQERTRSQQLSQALDQALDQALASFAKFHRDAVGRAEVRKSADLVARLGQAASEMATIAAEVDKSARLLPASEATHSNPQQEASITIAVTGESQGQPFSLDATESLPRTVALTLRSANLILGTLSEKLLRACLERVLTILAGDSRPKSQSLDLKLPLHILGEDLLMAESIHILSLSPVVADYHYLPQFIPHLPLMYRAVEGSQDLVPRLPSPAVQRIVRGKTRTRFATAFEPLQGEWLEAMDVEEYLEDRGIHLRSVNSSPQQKTLPDITDEVRRHEHGDYSIFGVPTSREWLGPFEPLPPFQTGLLSVEPPGLPLTESSGERSQVASEITIDIDKLVHLLAANATCLGPGPGIRRDAVDSSIAQSVVQVEDN